MRHQSLFAFALCAAAYSVGAKPYAANGTNYVSSDANAVPCYNTINGNRTTATDIDGNIIVGCGNVVSNNTNGTAGVEPLLVTIHGACPAAAAWLAGLLISLLFRLLTHARHAFSLSRFGQHRG